MSKIILVVDDEPHILDILKEQLEEAQYKVYTAEDAMMATTLAVRYKPDLIILDIMIPAGGGAAVYQRIKKFHASHVPVIFLSAAPIEVLTGQISYMENAIFMNKPWNKQELLDNIQKMLEKTPEA